MHHKHTSTELEVLTQAGSGHFDLQEFARTHWGCIGVINGVLLSLLSRTVVLSFYRVLLGVYITIGGYLDGLIPASYFSDGMLNGLESVLASSSFFLDSYSSLSFTRDRDLHVVKLGPYVYLSTPNVNATN